VRYFVRGEPVHVGRCHCADCRKESGSAFSVYAQWPVDACEITGEISSYEGRGFCGRCGSRLLDPVDPGDTLIEIRVLFEEAQYADDVSSAVTAAFKGVL